MILQEHEVQELKNFRVTDPEFLEMSWAYMGLSISGVNDHEGLMKVRLARMDVKSRRDDIEKVREELKEDPLRYGINVDGQAKRLTALLILIDTHLEAQEEVIEIEKARIRQEEVDRKVNILIDRINSLIQYSKDTINAFAITSMSDEEFDCELIRVKAVHDKAIEQKRLDDVAYALVSETAKTLEKYGIIFNRKTTSTISEDEDLNPIEKRYILAKEAREARERKTLKEEQLKKVKKENADALAVDSKQPSDEVSLTRS